MREIDLAFIKVHVLYHASEEEVFGIGLIGELARHGYKIGPGTLYPLLRKLEEAKLLHGERRIVKHRQRKYYRITQKGLKILGRIKGKIKELHKEVIEKG